MNFELLMKLMENFNTKDYNALLEKISSKIMDIFEDKEEANLTLDLSIDPINADIHISLVSCSTNGYFGSHWNKFLAICKELGFKTLSLCDRFLGSYDYWGRKGFTGTRHDDNRVLYL